MSLRALWKRRPQQPPVHYFLKVMDLLEAGLDRWAGWPRGSMDLEREVLDRLSGVFERIGVSTGKVLELGAVGVGTWLVRESGWSGWRSSADEVSQEQASNLCAGSDMAVIPWDQALNWSGEVDLLVVHLMGAEWEVWSGLREVHARVVCVHYNASIGPWQRFVCKRSEAWAADRNYSASLRSLQELADQLGYALVGCGRWGREALFVRRDLLSGAFKAPGNVWAHYRTPKFRYGQFGYPAQSDPQTNIAKFHQRTGRFPRSRAGTWDLDIWNDCVGEYAQLPERFNIDDVVVDIGSHIGGFSAAVSMRGEPHILAFEANPHNFKLAQENLRDFRRCQLQRAAVWRSDVTVPSLYWTANTIVSNTGGGTVVEGMRDSIQNGIRVDTVALDGVLRDIPHVRYLKIDAEGSEYAILSTCSRLAVVEEIGGEFHEFPGPESNMSALAAMLRGRGFSVVWRRTTPNQGLFFASRNSRRVQALRGWKCD